MTNKVIAPWTPEQVSFLQRRQSREDLHEYTCGRDSTHAPLIPTQDGWVCRDCDYTQDWAHEVDTHEVENELHLD